MLLALLLVKFTRNFWVNIVSTPFFKEPFIQICGSMASLQKPVLETWFLKVVSILPHSSDVLIIILSYFAFWFLRQNSLAHQG